MIIQTAAGTRTRAHTRSQPHPGLGTLPAAPQGPEWPARPRGEPTLSAHRGSATHSQTAGHHPAPGYRHCPGRHTHSRAGRPGNTPATTAHSGPAPNLAGRSRPLTWRWLVTGWAARVSHGCPERKAAQTCGCGSGPGSGRSGLARPPGASGETESRRGWARRGPQRCRFSGGTGRPRARGPGGGRREVPPLGLEGGARGLNPAGTGAPLRSPRPVGL